MAYLTADARDAYANSRDAQIDADTLRAQAARSRQPRRGQFLAQAETLELQSASWLVDARRAEG